MLHVLHTHRKTDADTEGTVVIYVDYGELLSDHAGFFVFCGDVFVWLKFIVCARHVYDTSQGRAQGKQLYYMDTPPQRRS
jgi:hypothetical protein